MLKIYCPSRLIISQTLILDLNSMSIQNYQNHKRFYAPHHFVLLPLLTIALGVGIYRYFTDEGDALAWLLFSISIFFILYLALMLRQHYALTLQNRIVKLEFRQRYYEFTGERSEATINKMNFGQIAALRFADDAEFLPLLEQTLSQNLSADDIKKKIKNWRADHDRV